MRALVIACVVATGCRQLIGVESGELVDHDEDGDGIVDGRDNCPADANPGQQSTEAGIGVLCDPRPEATGDRLALFLSFYPDSYPADLEASTATVSDDAAQLTDVMLTTREPYAATVVSTTTAFVEFVGTTPYFELAVGDHACRIASCGSRLCVVAMVGGTTTEMTFNPTTIDVTFALVQQPTQLACTLAGLSVAVTLPTSPATAPVTVHASEATMSVEHLAIYE